MKKFFLIFITSTLFIIASCKKQKNYISETESAEVLSNMDIDSISFGNQILYRVIPGNKIVFKYDYVREDNTPGYIDAFTHRTYAFSIDLTQLQTSFLLTDDQIKKALAFDNYFTGDGTTRSTSISKGKITGTKINNSTWLVVMHFELATTTIDLTKNFSIK